jgi:hypothetical protein
VGPAVGQRTQRVDNYREDAVDIVHDIFVCEPKGRIAATLKQSIASRINDGLMRPAVDFDNQGLSRAQKIRDERRNCDLPAKLEAIQLGRSKYSPEPSFGFGRQISQFSCSGFELCFGF